MLTSGPYQCIVLSMGTNTHTATLQTLNTTNLICACEPEHFCDSCLQDLASQDDSQFTDNGSPYMSRSGYTILPSSDSLAGHDPKDVTIAALAQEVERLAGDIEWYARSGTSVTVEATRNARSARALLRRLGLAGDSRA